MESRYCYGWEKGKKKDKIEVIGVEKVNVSKMFSLFVGNKVHHSISVFQQISLTIFNNKHLYHKVERGIEDFSTFPKCTTQ